MIVVALALSWQLTWIVTLFIGLGALTYVVVYTCWLKRRTTQNIVVGGLAGSWAALAGWFSISEEISFLPVLLALVVFLWTPVHFWSFALAHLADYRRAGLPMLPVVVGEKKTVQHIFVYAILSIVASGLLLLSGYFSTTYLVSWLVMAGIFSISNIRLRKQAAPERAALNYRVSGLFLLGIFLAIGIDVTISQFT